MTRLTGLDGAFLALESPTTHLHVMGTMVFDPSDLPGGLTFRRIRSLVEERVPLVPPFRMRMVEVPFGLQHPALVEDPEFDLDYHVRRASLPAPGGAAELTRLVADVASRPLDRSRPLWEFHVVEGLEGGRVGLVSKVHHAIVDGVSGADVLAAFLDLSPDPTPRPLFGGERSARTRATSGASGGATAPGDVPDGAPAGAPEGDPGAWTPAGLPGDIDQLRRALSSLPGQIETVARTIAETVRTARTLSGRNHEVGGTLPPAPFQAPQTSINAAISSHRRVAFADLSLVDIRHVRDVLGGTTNDIVLAVTAGALRTFFAGRGEDPDTSLVALVPVSVRSEADRGALGNRVSALLVSLATGVADPVARLGHIRDGMRAAKEQHRTVGPDVYSAWAEAALPAFATRMSRLVTSLRLFDHVAPLFNVVVSNVPGPDVALHLAGARMASLHPLGPIVEGVGVNVTVFSYLDSVHVGIQACWDLVPDVDVLGTAMEEALAELVHEAVRRTRPVPWWHAELPA
ncbi:MAG: wax ester/triacylglycerol synthase family O-acyltransferase [Acidimicrobiales bacterium]